MSTVIYAAAMAATILALWWVMNAWAKRVWGKAYDKALPMGEMMAKVGVAPETMASVNMRGRTIAAARRCAECANEAVCHEFLDGRTDVSPKSFCPNAELFESLKK